MQYDKLKSSVKNMIEYEAKMNSKLNKEAVRKWRFKLETMFYRNNVNALVQFIEIFNNASWQLKSSRLQLCMLLFKRLKLLFKLLSRISVNLYFRQAQLMQSMEGWLFSFENRKYYLWHEEVYWRFRRRVWTWCFEEFEIVLVFDKGKFSSELVEIKQLLSKEKEFKFKGISFLLRRWKQL